MLTPAKALVRQASEMLMLKTDYIVAGDGRYCSWGLAESAMRYMHPPFRCGRKGLRPLAGGL